MYDEILHLSIGSKFDLHAIDKILADAEVEISFYGAPQKFALDGGRLVNENQSDFDAVVDALRSRCIPFYLCCNTVAAPDVVNIDKETLQVLDSIYTPGNGVVVAQHWIAKEIRKLFPKFQFIFSSIGALTETWDESYIFNNYDVVVCPVSHTNNFNILKNPQNWAKLEVFLNNECIGFGPHCLEHYRYNSLVNSGKITQNIFSCPVVDNNLTDISSIQPSFVDLIKYVQLGVRRFKVIERTADNQDYGVYLQRLHALIAESREIK